MKTVLEEKSVEGLTRNRPSGCRPPLPGWIGCCRDEVDCLPPCHRTAQHQEHSSSTTTEQQSSRVRATAEQHRTRSAPIQEQHDHRDAGAQERSTTSDPRPTLDSGSAGAAGCRNTPKTQQKQHAKTSTRSSTAARQPERRSEGDDERAEALCPTKAEKG